MRALSWVVAAGVVVAPLVRPGGLLGPDLALAAGGLSVTGSVAGLSPGVPSSLVLTVHNDDGSAVVVGQLAVDVTDGGTATCPASALAVSGWHGRLTVPAHGSAAQAVRVLLAPSAVCDGVRWSLRYTAVPA